MREQRLGHANILATLKQRWAGAVRAPCLVAGLGAGGRLRMANRDPFKYFKTSPEIIRLAVKMYICFALPRRDVEELLHERSMFRNGRDFTGLLCRPLRTMIAID